MIQPNQRTSSSSGACSSGPRVDFTDGMGLTVRLSSLTALQILFSFGIQVYTVVRLGAGVQTDALAAGYTLPQIVMAVTTDVLSYVLVPMLAGRAEDELKRNGWELFVGLGCILILLSCILCLGIPGLIPLLVPGFDQASKQLVITLARIQVFSLIGVGWYVLLTSLYQVRGRFLWPVTALLISHVAGLGLLAWKLPQLGIVAAAWVQLFVSIAPVLLLLPTLGAASNFTLDFSCLRQALRKMQPLCLGAAYFKTWVLPDRLLGSFLVPGSIIILDLANRTCCAIERVLNQGIVSPMVPPLATMGKSNNWIAFRKLYRKKLLAMFSINAVIALLVLFAYAALSNGWARVLPVRILGNIGPSGAKTMVAVLAYMSGRVLFTGPNHTLASAFYASGDQVTPTKINAITYTVGLVAKVIGFLFLGLRGIALSTSFWALITFFALDWRLTTECLARVRRSHRPETAPENISATPEIAGGAAE